MSNGVVAADAHIQISLHVLFLLADPLILLARSGRAHFDRRVVMLLDHDGAKRKVQHMTLRMRRPLHAARQEIWLVELIVAVCVMQVHVVCFGTSVSCTITKLL